MSAVVDYVHSQRERYLEELKQLLRIPSISTDKSHGDDIRRAAEWVRDRMAAAGCTRAELRETTGHPIVYGEWLGAPGKPTVLVYGHYDVQPVDPVELWRTPPFEPTVADGRIYARGASDDKGQFIIHINALEAHLKTHGTCPVNVKFVIEGEEEIGSSNLEDFIANEADLLRCDAVVISDTAMFDADTPSICFGLRGISYLQIEVTGTDGDLHSGSFGGAVVNPANALVAMLASLKDERGRITIPGFYDDVRKLKPRERKEFERLPHRDGKFRKSIGAPALFGEKGFSTLERLWARPTLDINGIWAGFTGEGAKTVIPAKAYAKISSRLVPDQKASAITRRIAKHLKKIAPESVKVRIETIHGGEPWVADTDHPALVAAGKAIERAFGRAPVFVREGGSIPVVATFDRKLGVPSVLMGIGLDDDNLHAPNEKMELVNFERGNDAAAVLFEELGGMEETARASSDPEPTAGTKKKAGKRKKARRRRSAA